MGSCGSAAAARTKQHTATRGSFVPPVALLRPAKACALKKTVGAVGTSNVAAITIPIFNLPSSHKSYLAKRAVDQGRRGNRAVEQGRRGNRAVEMESGRGAGEARESSGVMLVASEASGAIVGEASEATSAVVDESSGTVESSVEVVAGPEKESLGSTMPEQSPSRAEIAAGIVASEVAAGKAAPSRNTSKSPAPLETETSLPHGNAIKQTKRPYYTEKRIARSSETKPETKGPSAAGPREYHLPRNPSWCPSFVPRKFPGLAGRDCEFRTSTTHSTTEGWVRISLNSKRTTRCPRPDALHCQQL